jgi:molybdopterin molybdotransferase
MTLNKKRNTISFGEAVDATMQLARPLGTCTVELSDSLGRILAEDVFSDRDIPPFNKSAMDGFACRRENLGEVLTVLETVPAGALPTHSVGACQCTRIMTGAMVPEGADVVIRFEDTENSGPDQVRFTGRSTQDNICLQGEDGEAGIRVLTRGTRLGAAHVAILASVGQSRPCVYRRPRVGIIATGDELVEPSQTPGPGQIRNSNGYQLSTQTRAMGAIPDTVRLAGDTHKDLDAAFKEATAHNNVVLLSGGVSQGDFDLVPEIMTANGVEILYDRISIKPGRPTTCGVTEGVVCFGLAGNPVATFVMFEILVKPFLFALMGHEFHPPALLLPLEEDLKQRHKDRDMWVPVSISEEGGISPVSYHGSAHFLALALADGLALMKAGSTVAAKGTTIPVRLL